MLPSTGAWHLFIWENYPRVVYVLRNVKKERPEQRLSKRSNVHYPMHG